MVTASMPAVNPQAVLEVSEVKRAAQIAREAGPMVYALFAWMYEFGSRAAEPGLQLLRDLDLRAGRARPAHLKGGKAPSWHPLLPFCRESLPGWLVQRDTHVRVPEQKTYLFPSHAPGTCYTCRGTGKRPILKREGEKRWHEGTKPCHHCGASGKRYGLSRQEAYVLISDVLTRAGIEPGRRHPHVLRHSIISHLLDAGVSPRVVQDRVGHRRLDTTLEYAKVTQAALAELEGRMSKLYEEG